MMVEAPTKPLSGSLEKDQLDQLRFALVSKSFLDFLDYVYIHEPPPGRLHIKFEKWPYLMEMAEAFASGRDTIVLKARQLGFSWLVAAYVAWRLRCHEGTLVLMLSQGQLEAQDLLAKVKYVLDNLPKRWLAPYGLDSRSQLSIPAMKTKVTALPATKNAGRSENVSLVVQDEAEHHEYFEENYKATRPTVGDGGQFIIGSTVDKTKAQTLFKEMWKTAHNRASSAKGRLALFYPWNARPGRDAAWHQRTYDDVPVQDLKGLSRDLYMEQEYPGSSEEALSPAASLASFNKTVLDAMRRRVKKHIGITGEYGRIYEKRRAGGRYVAASDISHGIGLDMAVTVIMERGTCTVVADIMSPNLEPEALAFESMKLLEEYGKPTWGIEDNDAGILCIRAAERERYPRIFSRRTSRNTKKIGWHTDGKSRWELWGGVRESIDAGQLTVYNQEGLDQFFTCIRNPEHQSRDEAMAGAFDDYPVAVGIALQMPVGTALHGPPVRLKPSWGTGETGRRRRKKVRHA